MLCFLFKAFVLKNLPEVIEAEQEKLPENDQKRLSCLLVRQKGQKKFFRRCFLILFVAG